jgi:hypothetical protein
LIWPGSCISPQKQKQSSDLDHIINRPAITNTESGGERVEGYHSGSADA